MFFMEFSFKKAAPPKSGLEEAAPSWSGGTVVWEVDQVSIDLTPADVAALQKKHGTKAVNYKRAALVKKLMLEGMTQARIVMALRSYGYGFGERMIKADHAALSAVAKTHKKRCNKPIALTSK